MLNLKNTSEKINFSCEHIKEEVKLPIEEEN
jgi:hypothetical protein